jgi:hypothetical protein
MGYDDFSNHRWLSWNGIAKTGYYTKATGSNNSNTLSFILPLGEQRNIDISWIVPQIGNVVRITSRYRFTLFVR